MLAGPQPFSLRLFRPAGLDLRPGGLVSVKVLARLPGGKWSVSVQGRVLTASAEVELTPGARLWARVSGGGGRLVLRVLGPAVGQGESPDRVAAAFLAAGQALRPEAVQKARRLLERLRFPPQRFARLAVMLAERGVELDSPGVAALLEDLDYGQSGGGEKRRPWPSTAERLSEELRKDLGAAGRAGEAGEGGKSGALPLFNHIQPAAEQWFVVPYRYGDLAGNIRLRRPPRASQADRLVLETGTAWSFVLSRKDGGWRLHGFCRQPGPSGPARRGWRRLAQKLQNLGVETDDTIHGDDGFDGFSLPWEAGPYQRVDTEG